MATAIASTDMVLNTAVITTGTLATSDTNDLVEVFEFSPKKGSKFIININNVAVDQGTVTFSLAAGTQFASVAALTGSVAQGVYKSIQVDTAKYMSSTGKLTLTVTPASGIKLKTGHDLTVAGIQLA